VHCSLDIFRCTLTKIPETNSILQKSRLPLGVLIHPFKDLTVKNWELCSIRLLKV
jgi:protein transport protein SEC24